jgi:hypothetical protein
LFDVKFNGKHFPKSADELLSKGKHSKPLTDDQWRGLAKALEATFETVPAKNSKNNKGK